LYTIAVDTRQGAAHCLTSEFEGNCSDWTNSDTTDEHMMPAPPWSPDGKTLYVMAAHRGATRVFAIPSDGAGKQPLTLTPGNVHVRDFSIDHSRAHLALLIEDPAHVTELFTCATS